jgi:integrase
MRSDETGWIGLSILSRWTHGFESRWGCQQTPGQSHSAEWLAGFSPLVANGVPMYSLETAMKGFIRGRGDAWELRVYLGTEPFTNKQRYASRTVSTGKREAQRVLNEMISEAERGLSVRTSATVGDLLEQWFEFAARDFSPKTVKETRGFIDRNLLPALGTVPLSKLKAGDLDRFYRKLSVDGGSRSGPLAPGTVRRIHGILRRALGQGLKWGWIGVNPAVATTPPRVPQPDINPPSSAEVARLLRRAAETSLELACFLMLSAATGARRSEIVAPRWSDIDLPNRTVAISRGVVTGPDGLVEKDTKSHAARRLALDESAAVVLADHAAHMQANAAACRITLADTALVFSNAVDGSEPGTRTRCHAASNDCASRRG